MIRCLICALAALAVVGTPAGAAVNWRGYAIVQKRLANLTNFSIARTADGSVGQIYTLGAASGLQGNTVTRQWQRRDFAGAVTTISGATGLTYTATTGDIGYTLGVVESDGFRSITTWAGGPVLAAPVKIDAFDADNYTAVGSNTTRTVDTVNKIEGSASIAYAGPASTVANSGFERLYSSQDITQWGTIAYSVRRSSAAGSLTNIATVLVAGSGQNTQLNLDNGDAQQLLSGFGWYAANVSEFSAPYGVAQPTTPKLRQIVQQTSTATGAQVNFDAVYVKAGGRPTVVLTFDDHFDTDYTVVTPLLVARNIPATAFFVSSYEGTAGHLSRTQAQAMYDTGLWDFGINSSNDQAFNNSTYFPTTAAAVADVQATQSLLISRGWTRNQGYRHMDWPFGNGAFNQTLADAFTAQAGILTARGPSTPGVPFFSRFGPGERFRMALPWLGFFSNTGAADVKAQIDSAILRGQTLVLTMHNVLVSQAIFTGYQSGTTLTVTAISSGSLTSTGSTSYAFLGDVFIGNVTAQTSGTAGSAGTYTVSTSQTIGSSGSPVSGNLNLVTVSNVATNDVQFTSVLDYIKTKRDDGLLDVLTQAQFCQRDCASTAA